MTRRIETEAGTIVGKVDRIQRRVDWHLECPDCQALLLFTDDAFHGRAPLFCECGWKSRPIGHKERSEDGSVYVYHDYSALLDDGISGVEPGGLQRESGIHREMSL